MPDIPHLPNSPEEEIEFEKQNSYIEEWEKEFKQKSLIDMAKELKLIADNWDNLYNSENDQAADRK